MMNVLDANSKYEELRNAANLIKKSRKRLKQLGELKHEDNLILIDVEQMVLQQVMELQDQLENTYIK